LKDSTLRFDVKGCIGDGPSGLRAGWRAGVRRWFGRARLASPSHTEDAARGGLCVVREGEGSKNTLQPATVVSSALRRASVTPTSYQSDIKV